MDVDYCCDCLEEFAVGTLVDDRCPDCAERHNEAAYERQCAAFYGGDEPQTQAEQYRAAWRVKQEHR